MPILYVLLAWLIGLATAAWWTPPQPWLWGGAGLGLVGSVISWRRPVWRWLPLCLLGFGLASWRYTATRPVFDATHLASYHSAREVIITGQISGRPTYSERSQRLTVTVTTVAVGAESPVAVFGRLLVQTERYPAYRAGQQLQLRGELATPESSPSFDYQAYLARQGIFSSMSWPDIVLLAEESGSPWRLALNRFRDRAEHNLRRLLPDPHGALLRGILLGNDDDLSPELADAFRLTGMTHIIAISGFNIALLASLMLHLATPLLGPRWAVPAATLAIALYTILVGADASVVRAALMGGLGLFAGRLLGRTSHTPSVLLLVATLMTAINPDWLWDVGFQLSFAATLSLILYAEPLQEATRRQLEKRLPRPVARHLLGWISEAVLLTMAAQLLTLPLMVLHFEQLSVISLPANALILPAQPAVMIWGGLTALLSFIQPWLAQPFAWVSWLWLDYTITLVELMAAVPGAAMTLSWGPAGIAAIYAGIAVTTWWARRREHAPIFQLSRLPWLPGATAACLLGTLLLWAWAGSLPDGRLHIYLLDVGQGDAILLQTPAGRFILVDGGQYPARLQERLSDHLPFWQRQIDMMVVTHADADHVGGLPAVLERYEVGQLWTNGAAAGHAGPYAALLDAAEAAPVPLYLAEAGQVIHIDDQLTLSVLHPGPGRFEGRNDNSIVLRLTYDAFSLLLSGDIEAAAEQQLLAGERLPPTYALKIAHHGSESSSSDAFLARLQPSLALISAGRENQFGHPHAAVLDQLAARLTPVLRTDQHGTLELITNGRELFIYSHR